MDKYEDNKGVNFKHIAVDATLNDVVVEKDEKPMAMINGVRVDFDIMHKDVVGEELSHYSDCDYIGVGFLITNPPDTEPRHFWKRRVGICDPINNEEVEVDTKCNHDGDNGMLFPYGCMVDGYEDTTKKAPTPILQLPPSPLLRLSPFAVVSRVDLQVDRYMGISDEGTLVPEENKTNNGEIKMVTKEDILRAVKENESDGVSLLLDYCKLSFSETFNSVAKGGNADEKVAETYTGIQDIILSMIDAGLISESSKDRIKKALNVEMEEYSNILQTMEAVTESAMSTESKNSDSINSTLLAVLAIIAVGAVCYIGYRYLNPEDVIIDADTLSIMSM